mmetsp:Transcript_18024/g.37574  ORF Transcript_18024/g.37574 Transcript_18024/m.37574 type:complete len:227 (+) Transcript_18024:206-886(+)
MDQSSSPSSSASSKAREPPDHQVISSQMHSWSSSSSMCSFTPPPEAKDEAISDFFPWSFLFSWLSFLFFVFVCSTFLVPYDSLSLPLESRSRFIHSFFSFFVKSESLFRNFFFFLTSFFSFFVKSASLFRVLFFLMISFFSFFVNPVLESSLFLFLFDLSSFNRTFLSFFDISTSSPPSSPFSTSSSFPFFSCLGRSSFFGSNRLNISFFLFSVKSASKSSFALNP